MPINYEFLASFSPRLLDCVDRDAAYWAEVGYELDRPSTVLHVLALVISGRGVFTLDRQAGSLQPGHVFQVAPGSRMNISTGPDQTLRFLSIHFDYGLLRWEGPHGIWQPQVVGPLPFPNLMPLDIRPALRDAFTRVREDWQRKNIGYEWRTRAGFFQVLLQLSAIDVEHAELTDSTQAVHAAIEYIKLHLHEPLTRDTLASTVSLSPSYFSTMFRQQTGYSPTEFIHRLRIDRAKELLQTTSLSIGRIAEEVGFANAYYFTRVFTRETGISPRRYRHS